MSAPWIVGGCVYRSQVHVAHASSVIALGVELRGDLTQMVLDYQHTSNLPQGRSLWLRRAIDSESRIAISIDSDTQFDAIDLVDQISGAMLAWGINMRENRVAPLAIGIAPVIRGGERISLNIFGALGEPYAPSACGGGYPELWAGGFGLAVFYLDWWRKNWPLPYPEVLADRPYEDSINQGEDIQMCRSVASRGGVVTPLWVRTAHYDMSGHAVIGGQVGYFDGRMVCT